MKQLEYNEHDIIHDSFILGSDGCTDPNCPGCEDHQTNDDYPDTYNPGDGWPDPFTIVPPISPFTGEA